MRRNYESNTSEKITTTKIETRQNVRQNSPVREKPNDSTPGYMRPTSKKPNEQKSIPKDNIPGYMKSTKSQEQKGSHTLQTQQLEQDYVELNQSQHKDIDNSLDQETIPSQKVNIPGYMKPTKTSQENVDISRKRIFNDDSTIINKTSKIQVTLENRKVKQNEDAKYKQSTDESFYLKRSTSPQKKSPNDKFSGIKHETPKVKRAPSPKKSYEKLTSTSSNVESKRPSSPQKSINEKFTNTYSNVESKRPSSPQKNEKFTNSYSNVESKRPSSPQKSINEKLTSTFSNVDSKRPPSPHKSIKETTQRRTSSPHKLNEHHDTLTKKTSKTELQIELRASSTGEYLFFIIIYIIYMISSPTTTINRKQEIGQFMTVQKHKKNFNKSVIDFEL